MNWESIADNWSLFRSKLQERWGRLSEADLESTAHRRERVVRKLQERYGLSAEYADAQLLEWQKDMAEDTPTLVMWTPRRRSTH